MLVDSKVTPRSDSGQCETCEPTGQIGASLLSILPYACLALFVITLSLGTFLSHDEPGTFERLASGLRGFGGMSGISKPARASAGEKPNDTVSCPVGYRTHRSRTLKAAATPAWRTAIDGCRLQCDQKSLCQAFLWRPGSSVCEVMSNYINMKTVPGVQSAYLLCERIDVRHFKPGDAPLYQPYEFMEQTGAEKDVGANISIYAVGSSSLVWMTWIDQLHLLLRRLGYRLPLVPPRAAGGQFYAQEVPRCDDTKYFEHLPTTRLGRIGWNSWDFSFEGWEGCSHGVRDVEGHKLKCQHGPGCAFSNETVLASSISEDASVSDITLLATWFNDDQQWSSHYKCFNGRKTKQHDLAAISIRCLLMTIRKIHARSPRTWVLVMGKYPQTYQHITFKYLQALNKRIKVAVESEPRTLFIEYYIPNAKEGNFFQVAHSGHPNCRGSSIMAQAVVHRLFQEKILARTIRLGGQDKKWLLKKNCRELDVPSCHSSGFCWIDPVDGLCKVYSPGTHDYHSVCKGTICGMHGPR